MYKRLLTFIAGAIVGSVITGIAMKKIDDKKSSTDIDNSPSNEMDEKVDQDALMAYKDDEIRRLLSDEIYIQLLDLVPDDGKRDEIFNNFTEMVITIYHAESLDEVVKIGDEIDQYMIDQCQPYMDCEPDEEDGYSFDPMDDMYCDYDDETDVIETMMENDASEKLADAITKNMLKAYDDEEEYDVNINREDGGETIPKNIDNISKSNNKSKNKKKKQRNQQHVEQLNAKTLEQGEDEEDSKRDQEIAKIKLNPIGTIYFEPIAVLCGDNNDVMEKVIYICLHLPELEDLDPDAFSNYKDEMDFLVTVAKRPINGFNFAGEIDKIYKDLKGEYTRLVSAK